MNRNIFAIVTFTGIATFTSIAINVPIVTNVPIVQKVLAQEAFYSQIRPSLVLIEDKVGNRLGTGFIINGGNGTYSVLTATHVVRDREVLVRTISEVKSVENIIPLQGVDLALLQFRSTTPYTSLELPSDSSQATVNSQIFIVGYPAASRSNDPESSGGNVTSRQRSTTGIENAIIHNVLVAPGMSGSPVVTNNGRVVGIHIGRPGVVGSSEEFREAIPIEYYRRSAFRGFLQAASSNLASGNFDDAITSINQGRNLLPQEDTEVFVILAYAYFGKNEFSRAREESRRVRGENARISLLLGTIDYLERSYDNSITNLNIAAKDTRDIGGYALALLGLSYAGKENIRDANTNAGNAVNRLSQDAFVYLARSCVKYKEFGDDRAKTDLDNFVRLSGEPIGNPFLAALNPKLRENVRTCVPPNLAPSGSTPIQPPSTTTRYKLAQIIQLGLRVTNIAVSNNNQLVAAGLQDGNVLIHNLQTNQRVGSFSTGERADVSSVAFSPDGRDIAIASYAGRVRVFDIQNSSTPRYEIANAGELPRVVFNSNNTILFVGSRSGVLRIIDNRSGNISLAEPSNHTNGITALSLSPNGLVLASGGGDGAIKFWRASDLTPVDNYQAHEGAIQSLAFNADGNQVISIGGNILKSCIWRSKECTEVFRSGDSISSLAVGSNNHVAFSETAFLLKPENPIFLQDLTSRLSLGSLPDHKNRVVALAYTPNSQYLISGSADNTLIIWEVQ